MTEIFDQASSLADAETHAFEISSVVAKEEAKQAIMPPADIYAPGFNDEAFKAQMSNAFLSHYEKMRFRRRKQTTRALRKFSTRRSEAEILIRSSYP